MEDKDSRAGGLWKSIGGPVLLCDNCDKDIPPTATLGNGKHAVMNFKKAKVEYYCNTCYGWYLRKKDPNYKEREKLR